MQCKAVMCADAITHGNPLDLQDLDSLSTLPRLKYLSLLDNPVTKQVRGKQA